MIKKPIKRRKGGGLMKLPTLRLARDLDQIRNGSYYLRVRGRVFMRFILGDYVGDCALTVDEILQFRIYVFSRDGGWNDCTSSVHGFKPKWICK